MAYTSPTDDIIVQEGTFAFDFTASGTVKAGQGVICNDTMTVAAVPANSTAVAQVIGVAAYTQTTGKPVAVYGPGNIVRVKTDNASQCLVGEHLVAVDEGRFANIAKAYASGVSAIALENQTAADTTVRVLLI